MTCAKTYDLVRDLGYDVEEDEFKSLSQLEVVGHS